MIVDAPEFRSYWLFNDKFSIYSESQPILRHIGYYLRALKVPEEDTSSPAARLLIFNTAGKLVTLCCPEVGLAKVEPAGGRAWIAFRQLFLHLTVNQGRPHYVLHASAVVNQDGEAAIIAGRSDSGKTTTVGGLLALGNRFVCDDYALLDVESGMLLSFPLGATANSHTFKLLPELETLRHTAYKFACEAQSEWTINFGDIYPSVAPFQTIEPKYFFFLVPNHGRQTSIVECSRDEALWWLQVSRLSDARMSRSLQIQPISYVDKSFALMTSLLARCRFYRVENGNYRDTVDTIASAMCGKASCRQFSAL